MACHSAVCSFVVKVAVISQEWASVSHWLYSNLRRFPEKGVGGVRGMLDMFERYYLYSVCGARLPNRYIFCCHQEEIPGKTKSIKSRKTCLIEFLLCGRSSAWLYRKHRPYPGKSHAMPAPPPETVQKVRTCSGRRSA